MCDSKRFHIDCDELYDDMVPGNFILIDDGKIKLTVLENKDGIMKCELLSTK